MICYIAKFLISLREDDRKPYGRFLTGHIERCPECRTFAETTKALATSLTKDSLEYQHKVSDEKEVADVPVWRIAFAGGALGLLLLLSFIYMMIPGKDTPTAPIQQKVAVAPAEFNAEMPEIKHPFDLIAQYEKNVAEQEITNIKNDIYSSLASIENCVTCLY